MQPVSLPTAVLCSPISHFLCSACHTVHSLFVVWIRQSLTSPPSFHPVFSVRLLRVHVSPKHPHHHLLPPDHLSFSRLIFLLALNPSPPFHSVVPAPLPLALKRFHNLGRGWGEVGWRPSWSSNSLDLYYSLHSPSPQDKVLERTVSICHVHFLSSHPLLFIIWMHSFLNTCSQYRIQNAPKGTQWSIFLSLVSPSPMALLRGNPCYTILYIFPERICIHIF